MTNPKDSPDRIQQLLRSSLPPVVTEAQRDLWPRMLQRLDEKPQGIPLHDWLLAAAFLLLLFVSPAAIPIVLYQL